MDDVRFCLSWGLFRILTAACLLATGNAGSPARTDVQNKLNIPWEDLASLDAEKAYQAMWSFVRAPNETVAFLQGRLKPVPPVDSTTIDKLIGQLDSNKFAVRDQATRDLERLEDLAELALRKAVEGGLTLEPRRRIEGLLARLHQPKQRRLLRAVEMLENIGTAEARLLLQQLAAGAAEALLTREAKGALIRLAQRPHPVVASGKLPQQDLFGDPLPAGATVRLGTVRLRPAARAAFSPDSKALVTCNDGSLHLFEVRNGKERTSFPKKVDVPSAEHIVVAPNGRLVAANRDEGHEVTVWELPSGKRLHKFEVKERAWVTAPPHPQGMTFSPDGKVLLSANGLTAYLWDMTTGKQIHRFTHSDAKQHNDVTRFSLDGRYLATASGWEAKTLAVWDVAAGKLVQRWEGATRGLYDAAFSRDGKTLATCQWNDTGVRLWDAATGKALAKLSGRQAEFAALAFSPDGKWLAAAGTSFKVNNSPVDEVHLWNLQRKEDLQRVLAVPGTRWVQFSPDGKTLACSCFGKSLRVFDPASGKEVSPFDAHRAGIRSVAYSPNGKMVATASAEHGVRLWDAATGKPLKMLMGHTDEVFAVVWSADGRWLASGSHDGTAILWDLATGGKKQTLKHGKWLVAVALEPGGRFVASARSGNASSVLLWDVPTGKLAQTWNQKEQNAHDPWEGLFVSLAFSPDGTLLADCNHRQVVRLRDTVTGQVVRTFRIGGWGTSVAFSPDGRTLAEALGDQIILWEVLSGAERARLPAKHSNHGGMAFSPDGRLLASVPEDSEGKQDQTIRVWDLATRQQVGSFRGHGDFVSAIAFSPDGRRLATASGDTTVLIWDLAGLGLK